MGWPSSPPSPSSICPHLAPPDSHCHLPPSAPGPIPLPSFTDSPVPRGVLLSTSFHWHHKRYRHAIRNHCFRGAHHRLSLHSGGDSHASEQRQLTLLSSVRLAQAPATACKPVKTLCCLFHLCKTRLAVLT